MMRILLLGKVGQLGWELRRTLLSLGEVVSFDLPEIDFTRLEALRQKVLDVRPQMIVNAVAFTAVDRAETESAAARLVNGAAPGVLAETARQIGAGLIHFSTDFVFDGALGRSYVESDEPRPLNVYGQTKLEGERAIQQVGGAYLILRASWVYSLRQGGFVTKVLQWSRNQTVLRMVTDQVGSPTWSRALAEVTAQVLAQGHQDIVPWLTERAGVYHLGGSGAASRFQWAQAILASDPRRHEQTVQKLEKALTAEFSAPATRPLYSALDCARFSRVFGLALPPWEEALALALAAE